MAYGAMRRGGAGIGAAGMSTELLRVAQYVRAYSCLRRDYVSKLSRAGFANDG